MNIAVLGGKFDPPHFGHLLVINQILEKIPHIDRVLLIPVNTHPWKTLVASPSDRFSMTKLLESERIKVSDIDTKRGGETYTIDTIKELTANKSNKYFWINGSDILEEFHKWRDYKKLIKLITFLIFPRAGFPVKKLPTGFKLVPGRDLLVNNYSSTAIRERVRLGLSIKGLVPDKVAHHIKIHHLYQKDTVYV